MGVGPLDLLTTSVERAGFRMRLVAWVNGDGEQSRRLFARAQCVLLAAGWRLIEIYPAIMVLLAPIGDPVWGLVFGHLEPVLLASLFLSNMELGLFDRAGSWAFLSCSLPSGPFQTSLLVEIFRAGACRCSWRSVGSACWVAIQPMFLVYACGLPGLVAQIDDRHEPGVFQ